MHAREWVRAFFFLFLGTKRGAYGVWRGGGQVGIDHTPPSTGLFASSLMYVGRYTPRNAKKTNYNAG